MDPLSITASILAIFTAAGKVVEVLKPIVSNIKDAPNAAVAVYSEVNYATTILSALSTLLDDLNSLHPKRRQLIKMDQLITTFTDGVLLFSQLKTEVVQLDNPTENVRARTAWARKEQTLSSLLLRLHHFKGSVTLMLNILQCDSDLEATRKQDELSSLVSDVLASNQELSRRLADLENRLDTGTMVTRQSAIRNIQTPSTNYSTTTFRKKGSLQTINGVTSLSEPGVQPLEFEKDLEESWVYSRVRRYSMDFSFRSSIALSHAWSALSSVSLSDISVISVVALPIYVSDITDDSIDEDEAMGALGIDHGDPIAPSSRVVMSPTPNLTLSTTSADDSSCGGHTPSSSSSPNADETKSSHPELPITPKSPSSLSGAFQLRYEVVILGSREADKTALTIRFLYDITDYDSEDISSTECRIDNHIAQIHIRDTCHQDHYVASRQSYIRGGEAFMLVFSVTSRSSFEKLVSCQREVLHVKDYPWYAIPMIIIGNHCEREREREVSSVEAQALAHKLGYPYLEVSSDTGTNVEQAFFDLVREARRHNGMPSKIKPVSVPVGRPSIWHNKFGGYSSKSPLKNIIEEKDDDHTINVEQ